MRAAITLQKLSSSRRMLASTQGSLLSRGQTNPKWLATKGQTLASVPNDKPGANGAYLEPAANNPDLPGNPQERLGGRSPTTQGPAAMQERRGRERDGPRRTVTQRDVRSCPISDRIIRNWDNEACRELFWLHASLTQESGARVEVPRQREGKGVYEKVHREWIRRFPGSEIGRTTTAIRIQLTKIRKRVATGDLEVGERQPEATLTTGQTEGEPTGGIQRSVGRTQRNPMAESMSEPLEEQATDGQNDTEPTEGSQGEAQLPEQPVQAEANLRPLRTTTAEVPLDTGEDSQAEVEGIPEDVRLNFKKQLREARRYPRKPGRKRFWLTQEQLTQLDKLFKEAWGKSRPTWKRLNCLVYAISQTFDPSTERKTWSEAQNNWKVGNRREEKRLRRLISWIDQEVLRVITGRRRTPKQRHIAWILRREYGSDTLPCLEAKRAELVLQLKRVAHLQRKSREEAKRKEQNENWHKEPSMTCFGCQSQIPPIVPNAEDIHDFWNGILGQEGQYDLNEPAFDLWREDIEAKDIPQNRERIRVSPQLFNNVIKKAKSFTAPGPDGVRNFWLKKLPSVKEALREMVESTLNGDIQIPPAMVQGRTTLVWKGNHSENPSEYRPIACLCTMYKACTGVVAVLLEKHCGTYDLLPPMQRAMRKGVWGTVDCVLLDEAITRDAKLRQKNLSVAWIDFQKAYDRVPHDLILEVLRLIRCPTRIIGFFESVMALWSTVFTIRRADGTTISTAKVDYHRGLFQGDSLSPLVFCLTTIPLSIALDKEGDPYQPIVGKARTHLAFMDDIKVFASSKKRLEHNLRIVTRVSGAIGARLGIEKCAQAHLCKGKRTVPTMEEDGNNLLSTGNIPELQVGQTYKYLGIDQAFGAETNKVKLRVKQAFLARTDLIWRSELNAKNKVQAYRTLCVSMLRYSLVFGLWTADDMLKLDRKVRSILRRHKCHGHNASVVIYHQPRDMGGRGIPNLQHERTYSTLGTAAYLATSDDSLVREIWELYAAIEEETLRRKRQGTRTPITEGQKVVAQLDLNALFTNGGVLLNGKLVTNTRIAMRGLKLAASKVFLEKDQEVFQLKQLHYDIRRRIDNAERISGHKVKCFDWVRDGRISAEVESRIMSAMDKSLRTADFRARFEEISPLCRLCGMEEETVPHIVSTCKAQAWLGVKDRHDEALRVLRSFVLRSYGVEEGWTRRTKRPLPIFGERIWVLWDTPTAAPCEARRPDLLIYQKINKVIWIVEGAVCLDWKIHEREREKYEKYLELKAYLETINEGWCVKILPLVIGVFGTYSHKLVDTIEKSGMIADGKIPSLMTNLSRCAILGTNHVICRHMAAPLGQAQRY